MAFFLDTSLIVAALAQEDSTATVRAWLAESGSDTLSISPWVAAEVSSALSIKVRTGAFTPKQHANRLATWRQMAEDSLRLISLANAHFDLAARFADQHETGLRAGDALHLAVASMEGLTLATLDQPLARIGPRLGIATLLVHKSSPLD